MNTKTIKLVVLILVVTILNGYGQDLSFSCFNDFSQENTYILKDINSSSAIFLGIAEGVDVNYGIHAEVIKFLNGHTGIRNILVERSYGEAYLFNLFLESGDFKYLEYDFEWSEEMKAAFGEIYSFNKNNTENRKLRFFGFDGIMFLTPIIISLQELIPKDKSPDLQIKKFIDSLKQITVPFKTGRKYTNSSERLKDLESYILYLRNEVTSKENYYREFFGENFKHVDQIISNKGSHLRQNRNKDMYNNILKLVDDFHIDKGFYAMVGELHVNKKYNGILS